MKTSVIIPARNASATIEACLKGIHAALTEDTEVIVVDDHSNDDTAAIAKSYAAHVESLPAHGGLAHARNVGKKIARGQCIVFVDSDVIVPRDAFLKIKCLFDEDPTVYALTGLLSKEHPHSDFFSQYKNLYMNYFFHHQKNPIHFLYGSIHAFREQPVLDYDPAMHYAEDTAMGMALSREGKKILLLKDLEVIHLKQHDFWSLARNDFNIPFYWARLFLRYQGWRQVLHGGSGFAHASKNQIFSILAAPGILVFLILYFFEARYFPFLAGLTTVWLFWNLEFFMFLFREKGWLFALKGILWTCPDQLIMLAGIITGSWVELFQGNFKRS